MGWGQVLRLLSMLDALVSQRACKGAVLHLLSGSAPGEEPLAELFPALLALLAPPPPDHAPQQQQCSELVATVLQSLCDQVRRRGHRAGAPLAQTNGRGEVFIIAVGSNENSRAAVDQ